MKLGVTAYIDMFHIEIDGCNFQIETEMPIRILDTDILEGIAWKNDDLIAGVAATKIATFLREYGVENQEAFAAIYDALREEMEKLYVE